MHYFPEKYIIQIWLYPLMNIMCVTFQMLIFVLFISRILLLFKRMLFTASQERKLGQTLTTHV